MKKTFLSIAFIFCVACYNVSSQGTWTTQASLGTPSSGRSKAASFEVGGLGYVGTGYNGTARVDFWQYDPVANVWTQKANFGGGARFGAIGFTVNGSGYIGTGYASPNYKKDIWKYSVSGNSWSQVADFGGAGRQDAACFVIGNSVYVGTGSTAINTVLNDFWKYNPVTDTWTQKANYGGSACASATGFSANGKGYICLGRNGPSTTWYNTIYQYDTTANTWTARANFSGAGREGAVAFVVANQPFVGTGGSNNSGTLYTDFFKYDPAGNAWSTVAPFPGFARSHGSSFSIGNFGYVGMGYTSGQVNTLYKYDFCSVTNTITATAPSCNGGTNGYINLTIFGATNPLTYLWTNASTIEDATGLAAGNYTVVITDANTCISTGTVTITDPSSITITANSNSATCNGGSNGSINITASGATSPYSYVWSNGSTTEDVSGLVAGNYSVVVFDAKGCSDTTAIAIFQPTLLTLSISVTPATCDTCPDGSVSAAVSGGTGAYSYAWSPTTNTSQSVTGLLQGQYTLCVTDANGCSLCDSVSIGNTNGIVEYNSTFISVYPNPSNGEFRISGFKTNAELSIYNCVGELVYKTNMLRKQENVNITSMPFGIYLLQIRSDSKIFTKKMILTK